MLWLYLLTSTSCGRTLWMTSSWDAGPEDASVGGDAVLAECEGWPGDLTETNQRDMARLGLGLSLAVAEGPLGGVTWSGSNRVAEFHIDTMWYGPKFLEGLDLYVPLDTAESNTLTGGGPVVIGFSGNMLPTRDDDLEAPIWWHKAALFPSSMRPSLSRWVGYHASGTPNIAVVRIVGRNSEEATFEVVETLAGALPGAFTTPWNTSVYPVPFPLTGPTEYIASLSSLTLHANPPSYTGVIADLREATPENRTLVEEAIADPTVFWDKEATIEFVDRYRNGWAFALAPHVLSTAVMGLADECCTGAGGRFVAHRIEEALQGTTSLFQVVTGGHAYYGEERCEEPYLLAVHGLRESGGFHLEDFACDPPGVVWVDPDPGFTLPTRVLQLAGSSEQRALVESWLSAAPAVYRLHPADVPAPPPPPQPAAPLFEGDPRAPWSAPVSAERAILAATHPVLLTVEEVSLVQSPDAPPDHPFVYYEVTLATTFSLYRFEHLTLYRVKIAFQCGDPRLLEVGADWLGALLVDGEPFTYYTPPTDLERAFLVPGLLLPNTATHRLVLESLPSVH